MNAEIGKRIELIRKNMDMTRSGFARLIGVSGQYLGTVERGKNGLSVKHIINICETAGVSADYILFGDFDFKANILRLGVNPEQISIALEIIKKIASFVDTGNCNEPLIQEVMNQQKIPIPDPGS